MTGQGNIIIDEEDLNDFPQYIEWNGFRYLKSDFQEKSNIKLTEQVTNIDIIPEEFLAPPLQEVVKKKPIKRNKTGVEIREQIEQPVTTGFTYVPSAPAEKWHSILNDPWLDDIQVGGNNK
jgi:hypothetical protein